MFIKTGFGAIEDDRSNVSCGVSLGYKEQEYNDGRD